MADQREHGVGGLEWRDLPARTPDTPLVPSSGARSGPDDETTVVSAHDATRAENSGTGEHGAGDPERNAAAERGGPAGDGSRGDAARVDEPERRTSEHARADAVDDSMTELDGPTRRLLPVPPPMARRQDAFPADEGFDQFVQFDDRDFEKDAPLDLSALRADDELLTALASHHHSTLVTGQDLELKALLQSWRLDVDAEPIGPLVDTDTALATIAVGAKIHKRKPRYLVPLATAAAVLVVMFAGMGLAARNAQPGDALWGLSQMLYSDHARSVAAAASVRSDLNHASAALDSGQFGEARSALVQAQQSLPSVDNSDGKAGLQAQQQNLLDRLDSTPGLPSVTSSSGYPVAPVVSSSSPTSSPTTLPVTTTPTVPPTTPNNPPPTTPPPTTTPTDTPQSGTQDAPGQPGDTGNPGAGDPGQGVAQEPVNDGPAQTGVPAAGNDTAGSGTAAGN